MTKDEIIKMARQAGMMTRVLYLGRNLELLTNFAKLVAEHEREMCAKEAERTFYSVQAAENIRARGEA